MSFHLHYIADMNWIKKPTTRSVIAILSLSAVACGKVIEADYCVVVMTDQSDGIGNKDNTYIVEAIDGVLLPLGYLKFDSIGSAEYKKDLSRNSTVVIISKNLGHAGTIITQYPAPDGASHMGARAAIIAAVEEEIRPKYLVRTCKEVGLTAKTYN